MEKSTKPSDDQSLLLHILPLIMIINKKSYRRNSSGIHWGMHLGKLDLHGQRGSHEVGDGRKLLGP